MRNFEKVWEFNTARFRIALEIEPEYMDPADSFQFEEDIDAVRNGEVEWFCACVSVYLDDKRIAWDYLGGCAYKTIREFYESHRDTNPLNRNCTIMRRAWNGANDPDAKISICHYFPSMVRSAIAEARKELCDVPRLRCA